MNDIATTGGQQRSAPTKRTLIAGLKSDGEKISAAAMKAIQTPASQEWLAGRVKTLLSHFFQKGTDAKVSEMQALDWMTALSRYPQFAVEEACAEYLRTMTRRPTPADIVRLSAKHTGDVRNAIERATPPKSEPPRPAPSPEESARVKALVASFKGISNR